MANEVQEGLFSAPEAPPEPSPVAVDLTPIKGYVAAEKKKKELDAELSDVKKQLEAFEAQIVTNYVAAGVKSMSVDGRLVYLSPEIFVGTATGKEKADVINALRAEATTNAMVSETYNAATLKSYVREIAKEVEDTCKREERLFDADAVLAALPEAIRNSVKISFDFGVRSRKA